jgi:CubicO group peptidase (beta-lactamase class C family)
MDWDSDDGHDAVLPFDGLRRHARIVQPHVLERATAAVWLAPTHRTRRSWASRGCLALALLAPLRAISASPQQDLPTASPPDVGMSQPLLAAAARLYADAVDRGDLAGVVVLVARHGKVVLHEAYGWSDRERRIPMTPATLVDIASMTKPLVATAALMMAERGQIALDDPVSKYVPTFAQGRSARITLRQLLNHTSGLQIPYHFVDPAGPRPSDIPHASTLRDEVARYPLIGPATEPGAAYSYSNPGFNTLAAVLEIAAGKTLPTILHDILYAPLGMTATYQWFGDTVPSALAKQYGVRDGALRPLAPAPYPFAIGSGRTASTAADYAKFCQMYLNGGTYAGHRILSAADVARAVTPTVRASAVFPDSQQLAQRGLSPRWYYQLDGRGTGFAVGYGLGWVVAADGTYLHPGVTGTFAWVDPARDLVGIILTQSNDARNPGIAFMAAVNAAVDGGQR